MPTTLLQALPVVATDTTVSINSAIIAALVAALASWVVKTMITRPQEKSEKYEEAKIEAILREQEEGRNWRKTVEKQITVLELQTASDAKRIDSRMTELSGDMREIKEMMGGMRESLAGLKVSIENNSPSRRTS